MRAESRSTLILSVVAFFVMLGVSIISPILPLYALSFGISLALVGLLISGFGLARLFLDIPSGMICDRIGSRRFMLYGLLIIAISSVVAGLAVNYWMLLLGRIFEGVGSAIYSTTSLTAVSRLAPPGKRGAHMSLYISMFLLGSVSGPAVGGFVAESFGLNAPFFLYAICAAFSFFLIFLWIKDDSSMACTASEPITVRQISTLMKDYDVLSINLATFAVFVTRMGVIGTIVPLYAYHNLNMTEGELGMVLTLSAVFNLFTMLPAGHLTDRYGRKVFLLSSLLFTALFIALIPLAHDMLTFTLILIALGFSIGLSGPIAAWITDVTRPDELGASMGLFRTIGDAGFVVAPIVLAMLSGEAGGEVSYIPFLAASVAVIALSLLLVWTRDPIAEVRRPSNK